MADEATIHAVTTHDGVTVVEATLHVTTETGYGDAASFAPTTRPQQTDSQERD